MKKDELKALVKKYFNLTENEDTSTQVSLAEATLADGTTKVTNKAEGDFEVDQTLFVILEDGSEVLAPSGEHATETGIVLTVDGEGIITGVKYPDEEGEGSLEEETATEEIITEELAEEDTELEDEDIKDMIIDAIMSEVAPAIEALKVEMDNCNRRMDEQEERMKEYLSAPAEVSTTEKKFNKTEISDKNMPLFNRKRYEMALTNLNTKK